MGNNDLSNSENILIKVDNNNLMYIDPNSVINEGQIEPRGIKQENLVMYVNLEADLIPRSNLVSDGNNNTLISVAKGNFNLMRNQDGSDFNTNWTNAWNGKDENTVTNINDVTIPGLGILPFPEFGKKINDINYDGTAQSFGIDNISIQTKGFNSIPLVTINFVDVRGKTLFESPQNSPYKAFFHLPWPIFYLTVKGYYGKAIKYRLHLVKFSSKFNENNGNFEITTQFVGSTFAFLNDITLTGILNSPYMYMSENESIKRFNPTTGAQEIVISKSTKGYQILNSVYNEYKQKGLIDKNFPVKTLRELIIVAESLDKILERELFENSVVDMRIFGAVNDYEKALVQFKNTLSSWGQINLDQNSNPININNKGSYYYLKPKKINTSGIEQVTGSTVSSSLEFILVNGIDTINKLKDPANFKIKEQKSNFSTLKVGNYLTKNINDYYGYNSNNKIIVAFDYIIKNIDKLFADFDAQKKTLQTEIEEKINTVISKKDILGFEPTIRNIFAVILSNAEVYIRLMKDVHTKAFNVGQERKSLIGDLSNETPGNENVYPWPEIRKNTGVGEKNLVLTYPGDPELESKLKTNNKRLWPEVDFMENFQAVATKKFDTLSDKEGGIGKINYVFENSIDESKIKKIHTSDVIIDTLPYVEKTIASFLYEIYERSFYYNLFDSFNSSTIIELANIEFENIKESISEDPDVISILKNNIKSIDDFINKLKGLSTYQRYPYLKDQLPTVPYIISLISKPYNIEQYSLTSISGDTINGNPPNKNVDSDYPKLTEEILDYTPQLENTKLYPYNSKLYLNYLNKTAFNFPDDFKLYGNIKVDTSNGFITSFIEPKSWVKYPFVNNIFSNKLNISSTSSCSILNTPYFHKQLFNDFNNSKTIGKYAGSAYLFLNSLPFKDIEDYILFSGDGVKTPKSATKIFNLFKEVGATHYIPYHLIIKWGSLYHRYKNYILNNEDILDGCLTNNLTEYFNGSQFFDNNSGITFTLSGVTNLTPTNVSYSAQTDIGIHPYYDAIFHQILNDYNHYDVNIGKDSYENAIKLGGIISRYRNSNNGKKYWTNIVDNSKYDPSDQKYTLLPSNGDTKIDQTTIQNEFFNKEQNNQKIIWEDENISINLSGLTFPAYNEYNRTHTSGNTTTDNIYGFSASYRKIIDLIGTFSPDLLDEFESMFLEFSSVKLNLEVPRQRFNNVKHYYFQDLLKEISTVKKESTDIIDLYNYDNFINKIKQRQQQKLSTITNEILDNSNLIKLTIANPKEFDAHSFYRFSEINLNNTYNYNGFNPIQLTPTNLSLIELYIGEDIDGGYLQFFATNDVELNEENIKTLRPIIQIFAGYLKENPTTTTTEFKRYLREKVNPVDSTTKLTLKHIEFLNQLIGKFSGLEEKTPAKTITQMRGYNDDPLKLETYNHFKSFNDKWVAGNSLGQRLLFEEFLFLDKANRDIGSQAYMNLQRLIPLNNPENQNQTLYGIISILLQGSNFDMRALPAYVNFYGANFSNKTKIIPSKNVAKNIFGTFLEVDYQESSPKIILQYVGPTSKYLDMNTYHKGFKFRDDSFFIGDVNKNPLIVTAPEIFNNPELYKSNRVVSFEVSFGDQNQSIFKGIQLDQSSIKNTTEAFIVMENLARSESGANSYQVDIGLFDIYRQASYTCTVTCMGNVMIQPTMYFYLKNIPMFKGSYLIIDVKHEIRNNSITTSFTGVRIPYGSLPDPKDSFMSSYKPLFDSIVNQAIAKVNAIDNSDTKTQKVINTDKGPKVIDNSNNPLDTNEIIILKSGLYNPFKNTAGGIPYNGFNDIGYIQFIRNEGANINGNKEWLRTNVTIIESFETPNSNSKYKIGDETDIFVLTMQSEYVKNKQKIKWKDIKNLSETNEFYFTLFDENTQPNDVVKYKTEFYNPKSKNKKSYILTPNYDLNSNTYVVNGIADNGPRISSKYGIAMSKKLAKTLKIGNDDIIYFRTK